MNRLLKDSIAFGKYSQSIVEIYITINDKIRFINDVSIPSSMHLERYVLLSSKAYSEGIPSKHLLDGALNNLSLALYQSFGQLLNTYYNVISTKLKTYTPQTISYKFPWFQEFTFKHNSIARLLQSSIKLLDHNPIIPKDTLRKLVQTETYFEDCWSYIISFEPEMNKVDLSNRLGKIYSIGMTVAAGMLIPIGLYMLNKNDHQNIEHASNIYEDRSIDSSFSRARIVPADMLPSLDLRLHSPKISELFNVINEFEIGNVKQKENKHHPIRYYYEVIPIDRKTKKITYTISLDILFVNKSDTSIEMYTPTQFKQFVSEHRQAQTMR